MADERRPGESRPATQSSLFGDDVPVGDAADTGKAAAGARGHAETPAEQAARLNGVLNHAAFAYYALDDPVMSDADFDRILRELQALEEAAKRMLSKLPEEYPLPPPEFELTGLSMEGLSRALMRILSRLERDEQPAEPRRIRRDSYTVQSCMQHIAQRLRQANGTALPFEDLLEEDPCRAEVVTLFMAMLEMLKLNRLAVRQDENFGEILLLPVRRQEYAR